MSEPSDFAKFIVSQLSDVKVICDIGAGNCRDSIYFASLGYIVCAIDQVSPPEGDYNLLYLQQDVKNLQDMNVLDVIYNRFVLQAITSEEEDILLDWSSRNLKSGGLLCIETRTIYDDFYEKGTPAGHRAYITDHYRRFIEPDELVNKLVEQNFRIVYNKLSKGWAKFGDEDPKLLRIIAEKK